MEKIIYLDNAATSFPKPQEVYDFMMDFYQKHGVNPGRSGYDLIVLGKRGLSGVKEFFMGSVSQKVLSLVNDVSVLLVN